MANTLALLHQWLADRQWSDETTYDPDDEVAQFQSGLAIDGIGYAVTMRITDQPLWVSVKLSPLFIVNGVQLDHVEAIVETINSQLQGANFRTYLHDGYVCLRYRAYAPLIDGPQSTEAISRLVDAGIAACAVWVPRLRTVGTSSRALDASALNEMLVEPPACGGPVVQQVISEAEFDRRWQLFLNDRPSPARSMSGQYAWLDRQWAEFQAMLGRQGILSEVLTPRFGGAPAMPAQHLVTARS